MKTIGLIIEDDEGIQEVLEDRLDSMGFDAHTAGSQAAAMDQLQKRRYDFVLLDLELPVRFGKPTSTQVGRNLLDHIRADERNEATPVIVITAHGGNGPDLAVELMKKGANDFIHKPSLHRLEDAIKHALHPKEKKNGKTSASKATAAPVPFEGGELKFGAGGVELEGIPVCGATATIYRVLHTLCETNDKGRRRAFSGKALADRLGLQRGQVAVAESISDFRAKVVQELRKTGFHADDEAVIVRGKGGYELAPHIRTDALHSPALPVSGDPGPEERQKWFLEHVQKRKLTRADFEKRFNMSASTSKRDLRAMDSEIEFVGTGKKGYYRLKRKAERTAP
jgi:CheY-like chemotaxis protein